jgi:hypothetical protein
VSSVPPPKRVKLPLLASLAALLLLAVLATRGRSAVPHGKGLVLTQVSAAPKTVTVQPVPVPDGNLQTILGLGASTIFVVALVLFLFGLAMAAVLLGAIRWRRRIRLARRLSHGDATVEGEGDGELTLSLLRGTRSALALLRQRAGGPPADAVQEAWLALERAAAEHGTTRRPEQTATEFTTSVLAAHSVDPAALATLRGLYQRARFGEPDTVTEADATAAIGALDRIAVTLAGDRAEAST